MLASSRRPFFGCSEKHCMNKCLSFEVHDAREIDVHNDEKNSGKGNNVFDCGKAENRWSM